MLMGQFLIKKVAQKPLLKLGIPKAAIKVIGDGVLQIGGRLLLGSKWS